MNLMAGHRCHIIHQLNPKACVDIINVQLKAIKAALRLSRRPVHTLMFKVGFHFRSLTTTKQIILEAPIYLGHWCPTIRFKWVAQVFFLHAHLLFYPSLLSLATNLQCIIINAMFKTWTNWVKLQFNNLNSCLKLVKLGILITGIMRGCNQLASIWVSWFH